MTRKKTERSGALEFVQRSSVRARVCGRLSARILRVWAVVALIVLGTLQSNFAQVTWSWRSESGNGSWSDGNNWWNGGSTGTPAGNEILRFGNNVQLTMTNNLGSTSRYRIFFDAGSGARTISGSTANTFYDYGTATPLIQNDSGNTQTIGFKIINGNSASGNALDLAANSGDLVFNGDVSASGGTRNIYAKGAANLYFNGAVTQETGATLNFNKEGNGTAFLTASNNYSGTTTVSAGVLQISNSFALGTTANGTTVASGAALQLGNNINVTNEALTIAGTGISSGGALRSVSGSNAYTGLITASSATTYVGAASGATLVISNVNSAAQEFWIVGDGTTIVAGRATNSGSGTAFVKTNTGTAILSASNAWSGAEYIREGTVVLSNNNALGVGGTTYLGANDAGSSATATLTLGTSIINSNAIVVEASGTGARTLGYQTASGTGTQLGSLTLNGNNGLAFNIVSGGTLLFGGGVTANGTNRLAVDGGGTLIVTNGGTGIAGSTNYQVRIGNGSLIIGAGTVNTRTNVDGLGHALDLGVDLSNNIVNATSTLRASNNVTVSNSIYVSTTSGQARILGASGNNSSVTYSGPIGLNSAAITLDSTNGQTVTVSGAITNFSGTGSLIKTGTGLAVLSGANTYTGSTTINGGRLSISSDGNLGTAPGSATPGSLALDGGSLVTTASITLNANRGISLGAGGGIIETTNSTLLVYGGVIAGSGAMTKSGAGTLTLSGANTYSGGTILTNGTLLIGNAGSGAVGNITNSSIGTGTLALNGGRLASDSTTARTIYNAVTVGGNFTLGDTNNTGALTFAADVDLGGAIRTNTVDSAVTMLGIVSNGTMQKNSAGTLTLSGANTYSGGTILNGGALLIANAGQGAVGNITNSSIGTGTLSLQGNARLASDGATARTIYNEVKLTGGTTLGSVANTGALTFAANVDLNNQTNIIAVDSAVTMNGILSNGGFTKGGVGTLTLTGANTYAGSTVISNLGTLRISNNTALGTTAAGTTILNNSSLELIGSITVGAEALSITGSGTNNGGALRSVSGTNTYGGAITLAGSSRIGSDAGLLVLSGGITGAQNLIIVGAGNTAINSVIGTSTGTLTKDGSGTLTLSQANTYSGGTLVSAGTLQIGAGGTSGSLSTSSVITNNATIIFNRSDNISQGTDFSSSAISGTGNVVKLGAGTITLTASNSYSGGTVVLGGLMALTGSGSLRDSGSLAITNGAFDLSAISGSTNTVGSLAGDSAASVNLGSKAFYVGGNNASTTFAGVISNIGLLTKQGTGTMILSGASSYSGGTVISNGAILMSNNSALGAAAGTVTLGTATTAQTTVSLILANGITNNNAIAVVGGANISQYYRNLVVNSGGTATQLGTIYLSNNFVTTNNAHLNINVTNSSTLIFGAGISVANNATTLGYGRIIVDGGGTVIMTNNGSVSTNTSVGLQMRVGNGTLVIGEGAINGRIDNGNKGIDLGFDAAGNTTSANASLYASNGVTVAETIYTTANVAGTRFLGIAGTGTATFSGTNSLQKSGLTVTAGSGGTVRITAGIIDGSTNPSNTITKIGAGTVILSGTNTYSGATTISEGELAVSGGGILTNTTAIDLSGGTSRFDISGLTAAGLTNGNAALSGVAGSIINLGSKNLAIGTNTSTVFAGTITNSGSLTTVGTGTLVLSGSNSYSGGTLVQSGTLVLSNNNALGAVGGVATLGVANSSVNSTLVLGDGVVNSNAINVSIQAPGYTRTLSVQSAGQTASQLGDLTLNSSRLTINVATNSTLLFGGGVNIASGGTGSAGNNLWLYGGGTLVVTNNGSVATSTNYQATVYDGTLVIGSGSLSTNNRAGATAGILLGAANFTTTNASSLYVSNGVTVDSLVWVNGATNGTAPTRTIGVLGTNGAATFSAGFGVGNTALNLDATNGSTLMVGGNITNISGNTNSGIIKTGGGIVTLNGTNTYTNYTTVSEGTLVVNGKIASLTNSVTNTGAVLSGGGSIAGTTTIAAGGTISPGNSLGTISVTNLVFGTNGNYNWQLYDATGIAGATNGYDTIAGAGGLNITANGTDKFNINLWTLSGLGPDTNGSAINFLSSSSYQWTLGTWAAGITNFDASYFNITTAATNGTGGFANAFAGTFSLTSSNNSIFLNYAGAAGGPPIYSAASGTWSTNFSPALTQGATNWIFDGATGGTATNDIASATVNTLGTLTFSNTAGSYTLSAASGSAGFDAASALAITGNIVNNSASAQTINLALGFSNAATINAAAGHMTFGGAISNGTSLTFTGASNNTVSGAISGTGYLVKDGAGTLVLSGNNTYTGGTLVSTGTLQVGAGGTSGSLSTTALTNNATLAFNRSDNLTASYDISGTGALIKDGAGTLTLSGNNSYGGATTISNGTISISVLANAGSNSGIGTNATVTFAGANATNTFLDYTGGNVTTDRTFAFNGVATNGEGGTLNMATSTVVTATGAASGTGKMILSEGTLVLSNTSTPNSFAPAAIQVDTGATLQLAANNQIGNTTGLILNGGTFLTGTSSTGFSDTLGTLTLSASSTIDLGSWTTGLRTLTFADSSAISWTGVLTITNWQGVAHQSSDVAQILFGTGGLTSTQLGQIYFANQSITGGELIGGGGELVPIPEPRVYAAAVALLAAVGWRERKRLRDLLAPRKK